MANTVRTVIPANAGVILQFVIEGMRNPSYPRECGGDPAKKQEVKNEALLSPRMRG